MLFEFQLMLSISATMVKLNEHFKGTLPCRIVHPRVLLGLVLEFPPQVFYSAVVFSIFVTLGYYSTLGFTFLPLLFRPSFFYFCQQWLL